MKKIKEIIRKKPVRYMLMVVGLFALSVISNLYLQLCQNSFSLNLMIKFAFSWHAEKFLLGCLVLLVLLLFLCSLAGSLLFGSVAYSCIIAIVGYADAQKMYYRTEPIYPDDLKMILEIDLLKEMVGTIPFLIIIIASLICLGVFFRAIFKSFKLTKRVQILRVSSFLLTLGLLVYIGDFNNSSNLLRKAYNRTAAWISYSQKMNYYNTGFVGGFLYNLTVEAMEKPENYSKETIDAITKKYSDLAEKTESTTEEQPNIVFIMSESFSNPQHLTGVTSDADPLADYYLIANQTYSGQMLSQNYGGGTANIEFEALTSFSMELFNTQLTTPYTMLVPKVTEFPSIVSLLGEQAYDTTAIHPYNTSMYKRKDVYSILGFDQFISEDTMTYTDKIGNNPYISDSSAYKEVMDVLTKNDQPQFVHLVTMQTHLPYGDKYESSDYSYQSKGNKTVIDNYMQDIAYSSEALNHFVTELNQLDRRTLVVFWGDHLPSIYSDEITEENEETTMHLTEFLMYDTENNLSEKDNHDAVSSPIYFSPLLFEQSGIKLTGFYQLLVNLNKELPAFEKQFYYKSDQWNATLQLTQSLEELYKEYQLIQYDIVSGEQYSLETNFFK